MVRKSEVGAQGSDDELQKSSRLSRYTLVNKNLGCQAKIGDRLTDTCSNTELDSPRLANRL